MGAPLLSIITHCLNRARYLNAALESARAQRDAVFEHIIVDGGSTDETLALLARHPHLRIVSEPDRGLYDALNKGLRLARGEILAFLNNDDLYASGCFAAVAEAFADPAIDVVTGGAEFFEEANGERRVLWALTTDGELEFGLRTMLAGVPAMNARFFRRRLIERVGDFDLSFPIAADRDWLVRMALLHPRAAVLPRVVYRYRQHEESMTLHDTDRNVVCYLTEHLTLAERHLVKPGLDSDELRFLRTFHTHASTALAVLSLRDLSWAGAARCARRGCSINPGWPLAFCRELVAHALGRSPVSDLARRARHFNRALGDSR